MILLLLLLPRLPGFAAHGKDIVLENETDVVLLQSWKLAHDLNLAIGLGDIHLRQGAAELPQRLRFHHPATKGREQGGRKEAVEQRVDLVAQIEEGISTAGKLWAALTAGHLGSFGALASICHRCSPYFSGTGFAGG